MNAMKQSVGLLSFCQAIMNSGVLLIATSSLVGSRLATHKGSDC